MTDGNSIAGMRKRKPIALKRRQVVKFGCKRKHDHQLTEKKIHEQESNVLVLEDKLPNDEDTVQLLCMVCDEDVADDKVANYPSCSHNDLFCNSCLQQYVHARIDMHSVNTMRCPHPECAVILSSAIVEELSSKEHYQKYLEECAKLSKIKKQYGVLDWLRAKIEDTVHNAQSIYRRSTKDSQRCPKCRFIIEKDGGCNHMTCTRCSHEFYWCCRLKYGSHDDNICGVMKAIMISPIIILSLSVVGILSYLLIEGFLTVPFRMLWYFFDGLCKLLETFMVTTAIPTTWSHVSKGFIEYTQCLVSMGFAWFISDRFHKTDSFGACGYMLLMYSFSAVLVHCRSSVDESIMAIVTLLPAEFDRAAKLRFCDAPLIAGVALFAVIKFCLDTWGLNLGFWTPRSMSEHAFILTKCLFPFLVSAAGECWNDVVRKYSIGRRYHSRSGRYIYNTCKLTKLYKLSILVSIQAVFNGELFFGLLVFKTLLWNQDEDSIIDPVLSYIGALIDHSWIACEPWVDPYSPGFVQSIRGIIRDDDTYKGFFGILCDGLVLQCTIPFSAVALLRSIAAVLNTSLFASTVAGGAAAISCGWSGWILSLLWLTVTGSVEIVWKVVASIGLRFWFNAAKTGSLFACLSNMFVNYNYRHSSDWVLNFCLGAALYFFDHFIATTDHLHPCFSGLMTGLVAFVGAWCKTLDYSFQMSSYGWAALATWGLLTVLDCSCWASHALWPTLSFGSAWLTAPWVVLGLLTSSVATAALYFSYVR